MPNELRFTVLGNFKIEYKKNSIPVELVEIGVLPAVKYFLIHLPQGQVLLHKIESQGGFMWLAVGGVSFSEAQDLGPEIEKQLQFSLPVRDSLNPFKYRGAQKNFTHTCKIHGITIMRAQSVFSDDIFYKIRILGETFIILHAAWKTKRSWLPDEPDLSAETLMNLSKFVEACEQQLPWFVEQI